jgi:histidyl-tRNA synthetase
MSFLSTQPYKGTRDFYPNDKRVQNWIFDRVRTLVSKFGYQEYDGPMLEAFELYAAKTGTEIVNQQLYHFIDRGDRKVAIRPEMTPTMARMVAGKFQELPKPVRWFSIPNLWRYERPQKGRLREHWQLNVDVLGGDSVLADAEVIELVTEIFESFGGAHLIQVRVNNRRLMDHVFQKILTGSSDESFKTQSYELSKAIDLKDKLDVGGFEKVLHEKVQLNEAQISNLSAFLKMDFAAVNNAYPCRGSDELARLFGMFAGLKNIVFDSSIMRGMDYYTGTVFEVYDISPDNRRALCGGGRYDNLMGLFGKNALSGMGFGLGDVTLKDFLETHKLLPEFKSWVDVFVSTPGEAALPVGQDIARRLRAKGLKTVLPLSLDGFGAQLKLATKLEARFAVLIGEEELKKSEVLVKDLSSGQQKTVKISDIETAF